MKKMFSVLSLAAAVLVVALALTGSLLLTDIEIESSARK
jgi:hypothetical protein